ncbi:MAG: putative prokaryotic signal transducing protein [Gaiellaceae bacterium]|nr:putative prokaryotic signal transducing protein [Gaiellaceae bacterium]
MADAVYLTLVPSEVEAELLCALLRTDGIECEQRPTNFSVGMMDGMPGGGPREVFVGEQNLARAREILAASRSD